MYGADSDPLADFHLPQTDPESRRLESDEQRMRRKTSVTRMASEQESVGTAYMGEGSSLT